MHDTANHRALVRGPDAPPSRPACRRAAGEAASRFPSALEGAIEQREKVKVVALESARQSKEVELKLELDPAAAALSSSRISTSTTRALPCWSIAAIPR